MKCWLLAGCILTIGCSSVPAPVPTRVPDSVPLSDPTLTIADKLAEIDRIVATVESASKVSSLAREGAVTPPAAPRGPVVVVPTPKRDPVPPVIPTPLPVVPTSAVLVFDAEPQCPPTISTITFPSRPKATCIQEKAGQAIKDIILTQKVTPGRNSPCWAFFDQMYINCIDIAVRQLPAISYGLSGHWLRGSLYGQPWEGCAAGVSGNPIRVSLAQPPRELALIAWESANYWMWITMDRLNLTDGPLIGQATEAALAACLAVN